MDYYPVNEYGPIMPGLVMAAVAIVHVFLAQFAVGAGIVLCYFQWQAMQEKSGEGKSESARVFIHGYFKVLVMVSFVLGALTGVAIWLTAIQVGPHTIQLMVQHFHWIWGIEWTFFCLEIVSGYCFYRYHERLTDREGLTLLVIYSLASWGSLFWINGILSWQLTPGVWLNSENVWDGLFNPSFWPSLIFRTIVALCLASLAACVVINLMPGTSREVREELVHQVAKFLLPMAGMPVVGIWYLMVMPADSRSWVMGGSAAMTLFLNGAIAASLAVGGYALIGMVYQKLYINGATATLLLLLAFGATAGGEFVREGSRKPFTIRGRMYSNGVPMNRVMRMRRVGVTLGDPFPLRRKKELPDSQVFYGGITYRTLCSSCHTIDGMNGLTHLIATWDLDQMRHNISKLQQTKPFMPPFAGTAEELESLVQFLAWCRAGRPDKWVSDTAEREVVKIRLWMNEAGSKPAIIGNELTNSGEVPR